MKKPFTSLEKVKAIAASCPTPFYLYDEKGIRENARRLTRAFSWNKGFREYFAVKATPTPAILHILQEEGCGLDCSSLTELMLAERCGFSGQEIMFSSNDTPPGEFSFAHRLGGIINLDDFSQIETLEEELGFIPETISCRFNPGGVFHIATEFMDDPGDAKYGMTEEQITEAFRILSQKGAKHFGMHAFLVSNALRNEYYPILAEILFKLAVRIREKTGVGMDFINLSGGIGIPYRPEEKETDIEKIGKDVEKVYGDILGKNGMGNIRLYTELGRYMLGPYGALVTQVINHKDIYKHYIGVDACAANLIRPAMYGAYHHITVLGKEEAPCDHVYDVTGSLCENNDKFAIDRELPKIDKGDYLFIHDAGAHSFSMGYNYNGRLRSAELLLCEDGSVRCIRRAETPEDYFATLEGMF